MKHLRWFLLTSLLFPISALSAEGILPSSWDPVLAGDNVMQRLVNVSAPRVKGAHDAEFVCVADRAYIVAEVNDTRAGESAAWPQIYASMSIVRLDTLKVERTIDFARGEQQFENETLPRGACFVPRILQKNDKTLRCYFTSEAPGKRQSQMWYRDFDVKTGEFAPTIHKAKLKTAAGTFDFQPQYFHADAVRQGFKRPMADCSFFIFDSFKTFDSNTYVALNNFQGKQNALALVHKDLATFEVIGHYNEPQTEQLSESAVHRLPDGTWLAICRNDKGGEYHFTSSTDGKKWTVGKTMPHFSKGANSKPTFDKFGDVYYLGWQEATRIQGVSRSVFNIDVSRDGKTWERKYRFETPKSFQYPTLHQHEGTIWVAVTQGDRDVSRKERIMFGKLESLGSVKLSASAKRIVWPVPTQDSPTLKFGEKLFTDREYSVHELPEPVHGLPFLRTSIEQLEVAITKSGTIFALTPTERPKAASQHAALVQAGFTKMDTPEVQLFPGEINRISLYRKEARRGERLSFKKMVLIAMAPGTEAKLAGASTALLQIDARTEPPVIITEPGAEFQDDARPGAMIIGMDRTPRGRIWGCWTGTGDKKDGYFILAMSDDGGLKWSKPQLVVGASDPTGKRQRGALVGNLWSDPLGRLWLFFDQTVIGAPGPTANWFIRCDNPDAAKPTWSQPTYIADGCTLNKPTVLKNGDWLLPVSHWAEKTAWIYASSDQGKTWKPRGHVKFPHWQFDEHMVVELRDGRLWMLARTTGNPYESFSKDQGATWSEPKPSAIQNVNARFFLRRLASGRLLLVKNGPTQERITKRSHLSAFLSDDDGKSWSGGLVLDERSSVSYPDGFESPDGLIHILYDWNRHTDAEILMAKFREQDVIAGKLISPDAKLRMLANKATGKKQVLYNGIEMPFEWPPRRLDPNSNEPMPVPYLQKPLKLIPIDVGRQLFVDDFLIESTTLKRTFHLAKKFEGNPVFQAETKHELAPSSIGEKGQQAVTYLGHGGVFYDPADKNFKMFYTAGWRGPLALATSPNLKSWTRPQLGFLEDNLLLSKASAGGDNSVWLDLASQDARLKFLTDQGKSGHSLQTSVDGQNWTAPVFTSKAADYCSIFHNPFRDVWCYSIKQGGKHGRNRWYHESRDFIAGADWSNSVFWANADRLDEPDAQIGVPAQLYSLSAVAYESVMLGMFQIHLGPDNKICDAGKFPKLTELKLGFSRDGFHWDRPDRRAFIPATRKEGDWDRAYLHTTTGVCVVLDEHLVFPYCGYSGLAPNGTRGMYCGGSIGLAMLRRDGFASMDATEKAGELITRPVKFSGSELFVNFNSPQGELKIEVLDLSENSKVLATSKVLTGDSTRARVEWTKRPDLSGLSNKRVRFRFQLTSGQLYSFWVSPDQTGVSNGFVGAGGPAFAGVRDVAMPN